MQATRMDVHVGLLREEDLKRALHDIAEIFDTTLGPAIVNRAMASLAANRTVTTLHQQPEATT